MLQTLPVTISATCQMLRPSTSSHPTPLPPETVLFTGGNDFRTFEYVDRCASTSDPTTTIEGGSHDRAGGGRWQRRSDFYEPHARSGLDSRAIVG
jgi:hypothetical protein